MSEKRTLDGGHEQHNNNAVARPPPLKKRFTTTFGQPLSSVASTSTISTSYIQEQLSTVDIQDTPQNNPMKVDNPECLSKKELLERMKFTKVEYSQAKDKMSFLDENTRLSHSMTGLIRLQLDLLRNEFVSAAKIIVNPRLFPVNSMNDIEKVAQDIQSIAILISNEMKAWNTKVEALQKANNHQQVIEFTKSEIENMIESHNAMEEYAMELQHENELKLQHIDSTTRDVWYLKNQLKEIQAGFETCEENIIAVEKKRDRMSSKIVKEILSEKKEEMTTTPETPETPDNEKPKEYTDHPQVQLEEYNLLASIRSKELIDVEKETYRLGNTADKLMMQVEMMSDEQILKSNYVHHLESSIDFHRDRIYYYEHKRLNLEKEYDKLKKERRNLKYQHDSEKAYQGSILATEEKNLKSNLVRITSQRNHLRQLCNNEIEKENQVKERQQMITNETKEQEHKIIQLQNEIIAKRNDDGSMAMQESHKLKQLLYQIDVTHGIMHHLGLNDNQGILLSNSIKETIQTLKSNLNQLAVTQGDTFNLLDQLVKQRIELTLVIDFFENTDRLLFAQMDCDGRVYEGRITHIKSLINEKKEQMMRLQAEKLKFSQTFPGLENERSKISNTIHSSKRIIHQQADRIKEKEKKEQELVTQVAEQEIILKKLMDDLENYHLQVDDYSQECIELEKRLEIYEAQLFELRKIGLEKTKSLDEEISLRKEVESEYEKIQKKWTMITLGENPASQQLIDEVEDLRAQFKCSTCKTRTRKCILLSCFHTFCNECIRIRLETRQRRCPSCALNFGASDVKEFYLYNTQ